MTTPSVKEYGEPHEMASTWHWAETANGAETGVTGTIMGSTEMEALDRLRLDFPDVGAIKWTARNRPSRRWE